jgi:DNA-binding response OmpR family regulator
MQKEHYLWIVETNHERVQSYQEIFQFRYDLKIFNTYVELTESLNIEKRLPDLIIVNFQIDNEYLPSFLKEYDISRPFIVLSEIDDIDAMRYCFQVGAVDFLLSPINKNELILRIERFLKGRTIEYMGKPYLENVNPELMSKLTAKELKIFNYFIRFPHRSHHRDDLMKEVWKDVYVHPKTLDVHIYNLRKKIQGIYDIKSRGNGHYVMDEIDQVAHEGMDESLEQDFAETITNNFENRNTHDVEEIDNQPM